MILDRVPTPGANDHVAQVTGCCCDRACLYDRFEQVFSFRNWIADHGTGSTFSFATVTSTKLEGDSIFFCSDPPSIPRRNDVDSSVSRSNSSRPSAVSIAAFMADRACAIAVGLLLITTPAGAG